ncbi:hypothetical protein BT96DRAFT_1027044 [Gymnopus androsaceus JB14]|uniref:Uncharacterized protein n=1 Tax=Gymnopus androsaceus JB14 TaxID=1447944 RepID=A0A6A4GEE6_9AGAR|nr:hypothetical protein BT96DRAFT_1027044 [Gymnopus androsaceus JB14]
MHDSPHENQSLPPTPGLSTPTSVPVELDLTLAVEQIPRGAGTSGIGHDEMRGVFKPSAAQLMSMVPARKHPGPRIRKHLPLVIPKIPSTPSNASNYTLSTPRNPSTPLLPSAMLPSPITPSFDSGIAEVIQPMNNTSGSSLTPEISPDRTSVDFSLSPDISLASLWSFDSSQPPTQRKDEMWINLADPNFSHSQKPFVQLRCQILNASNEQ